MNLQHKINRAKKRLNRAIEAHGWKHERTSTAEGNLRTLEIIRSKQIKQQQVGS